MIKKAIGTDAVTIGRCSPDPKSRRVLARTARIVQRLLDDLCVNGEIENLTKTDRQLIRRLAKAKLDNRKTVLDRYLKTLPLEEKNALATAVAAADSSSPDPDKVCNMNDVAQATSDIRWVWRWWFPYGMVSLLAGAPGIGKSGFILYGIVRALIKPGCFPDGQAGPREPKTIIWADTESAQSLTVDRIRKWKIPAERILTPHTDPLAAVCLDDPDEIDNLREIIRVHRPHLLVIDSLRCAHRLSENDSRMGVVVEPLAKLARDTGIAVLLVHHLRKLTPGEDAGLDDIRGTSALAAIVRSVVLIDKPAPDSEWARVAVIKSNVCKAPPALGFKIAEAGLQFGDAPGRSHTESRTQIAKRFLLDSLADGEVWVAELQEAAETAGLSWASVRRAQVALGIRPKKEKNRSLWSLPSDEGAQTGGVSK